MIIYHRRKSHCLWLSLSVRHIVENVMYAFLSNKKNEGGHPFTLQIIIPGWTAGGVRAQWVSEDPARRTHIFLLLSFFFLPHTFLPEGICLRFWTKKKDSAQNPSNCHSWVDSRWSACAIGKRGPPSAHTYFLVFPTTYFSPRRDLPTILKDKI